MTTHAVSQERHEIGIRWLSARAHQIIARVLRRLLVQVAFGIRGGRGLHALWERTFPPGDPNIRATDPISLTLVALALVGLIMIAAAVPQPPREPGRSAAGDQDGGNDLAAIANAKRPGRGSRIESLESLIAGWRPRRRDVIRDPPGIRARVFGLAISDLGLSGTKHAARGLIRMLCALVLRRAWIAWPGGLILLSGCSKQTPTVADPVEGIPLAQQRTIDRNELGYKWPFDVGTGTIACDGGALFFRTGGTTYALSRGAGNARVCRHRRDQAHGKGAARRAIP